ncbi:MAG: hypothetical protein N3B10_00530 [Armatimonadetes bacterium]|nr:hypothetical protein [Armatimonadota bacterium]
MDMRLQLGFNFSDLTKAWDGWFGMVHAFKFWLREELFVGNFSFILPHAVFGCALLLAMAAILTVGIFVAGAVQVLELSERFLGAETPQRRWQPTNELSPPA